MQQWPVWRFPLEMSYPPENNIPLSVATGSTRPKNREQSFEINSFRIIYAQKSGTIFRNQFFSNNLWDVSTRGTESGNIIFWRVWHFQRKASYPPENNIPAFCRRQRQGISIKNNNEGEQSLHSCLWRSALEPPSMLHSDLDSGLSELGLAQCEDSFPMTKPKGPWLPCRLFIETPCFQ